MPVPIQLHIHNKNVDIQSSAHYVFQECLCKFSGEHIKCIDTDNTEITSQYVMCLSKY